MDVKEVLEEQSLVYKTQGSDYVIRCLADDHEDNNPSLRIDKADGKMNCLSCGFKGNIFSYFNYDINMVNLQIKRLKDKILKIQQENIEVDIPLGAEYIHSEYRMISAKTMERFRAFKVEKPEVLEGRIVWPVSDISGEIKFLHGRLEHSRVGAKYTNYPKGVEKFLYPQVINSDYMVLVEGFVDMLSLQDKGLDAVCAFGSTLVSKSDFGNQKLIKKFSNFKLQGINRIYICFDGDTAGINGAKKLKEALDNNYNVEIIKLPKDMDPGGITDKELKKLKRKIGCE